MAKTQNTQGVGFGGSLKPKLIKGEGSKKSKVYSIHLPKLGRFAYTRDPGEAGLFKTAQFTTSLGAILYAPDRSVRGQVRKGEILDEFDLGSGLITNIGVTALANDSNWFANTTENLATLNTLKYMNWGTGTTAAAQTNWRLQTQAENEAGKKEGVAVTSSVLSWLSAGNAKLIVTGKLEQNLAGPTAITEWGLFSAAKTEGTTPKAATNGGANTGTTFTDTGTLTAPGSAESKKDARGAQQYALWAKEAEEVYGLVLKNTTTVATVPGWTKAGSEGKGTTEVGPTPSATSKYSFFPVMWDRRVFAAINVEKGNIVEFPYELTIEGGH